MPLREGNALEATGRDIIDGDDRVEDQEELDVSAIEEGGDSKEEVEMDTSADGEVLEERTELAGKSSPEQRQEEEESGWYDGEADGCCREEKFAGR